uniref:Uncharacterized protein n=1 Tax=Cacopsylla melanoneura TaxID=428564 RepID=A0A8D9EC15_9HEMI
MLFLSHFLVVMPYYLVIYHLLLFLFVFTLVSFNLYCRSDKVSILFVFTILVQFHRALDSMFNKLLLCHSLVQQFLLILFYYHPSYLDTYSESRDSFVDVCGGSLH